MVTCAIYAFLIPQVGGAGAGVHLVGIAGAVVHLVGEESGAGSVFTWIADHGLPSRPWHPWRSLEPWGTGWARFYSTSSPSSSSTRLPPSPDSKVPRVVCVASGE